MTFPVIIHLIIIIIFYTKKEKRIQIYESNGLIY
jgi:hypothetical protein